ncbi:acyltransferase [Amylibacter sp.]|nr:acyltransferase [Amylibacter sp.]
MKYRPEIDGLRALAVVPVILFHAGSELFSGGFVGVDVFFVISGYLITTILIEDIENKRFSIVNFYERRARRILPALFFVMLVCIPFAWMWMVPSQMKDFSQSLVAVSLFASNILFWRESGYFDAAAEEKPLLHTWSLAVEEQYYVLFPIFLILAWRFGKNRVFWMIVVMAAISLLLSEWGWRNKASANFYLAPTRAWELFAGSIAAFIVQKKGVQRNNFLSLIGLAAIIFSIFFYDENTPFPSVYALVPVLGVVLLVLYAGKETLAAKLLSTKGFVGIGLISYSAYLWHQPLFAFARVYRGVLTEEWLMIFLSAISLFFAFLSWKFIESPFRAKRKVSAKSILYFSTAGILVFITAGLYGHFNSKEINSGNFNPYHKLHNLELGGYIADNKFLQKQSWDILRDLSDDNGYGVLGNNYDYELWFDDISRKNKFLVVGNSHSKDIFNILYQSNMFSSRNQVARFGEQIRNLNSSHDFWKSKNYIAADTIVIATRYDSNDIEFLPNIIETVQSDGKKILLVLNIFEFPGDASGYSLIDKVVLNNLGASADVLSFEVNRSYFKYFNSNSNNKSSSTNAKLSQIANNFGIPTLNRMDYVCNMEIEQCFAVNVDLSKNFYDYGHHTISGSQYFSQQPGLEKFIQPLLGRIK